MTDTYTHKPIKVSADGTAGPYIMVRLDQLETVRSLLQMIVDAGVGADLR